MACGYISYMRHRFRDMRHGMYKDSTVQHGPMLNLTCHSTLVPHQICLLLAIRATMIIMSQWKKATWALLICNIELSDM